MNNTTTSSSNWTPERIDRLARALLPLVFDASVVRLPQPQPRRQEREGTGGQ
jgi:hypothetical protein